MLIPGYGQFPFFCIRAIPIGLSITNEESAGGLDFALQTTLVHIYHGPKISEPPFRTGKQQIIG